ncbi:MAG: hypothetical protein IKF38_06750 [Clostridia bacterium]|nr:hypothetical protein [Clostridia bacterium]
MKNLRENNAITLIALIVTIVVLLILSGITISMITTDERNFKEGTPGCR